MARSLDERRIKHDEETQRNHRKGLVSQLTKCAATMAVTTGILLGGYQIHKSNQPKPREYKNATVISSSNVRDYSLREEYDEEGNLVSSEKIKNDPNEPNSNNNNIIGDFFGGCVERIVEDAMSKTLPDCLPD